MHAHFPGPGNPTQQLLSMSERLARSQSESRLTLIFQGITSVSLGAITVMNLREVIRDARQRTSDHGTSGSRRAGGWSRVG
jgi:hypothetical protein